MTYDPGNIFAKMLRQEIPCIKVFEDEKTLAFLDIMPQAEGHTLVIPKAEAENLLDLEPDMAAALMRSTQKIAKAINRALAPKGFMLMQLNGAAAGQSVFHVHFHIIPRQDGIDIKLHAREQADPAELQTIAEKIRAALE